MARPRKPAAVQELSGSWEKNPQRRREEFDAGELGNPPSHLTGMEQDAWRELVAMFPEGVLQRTDRWSVEMLCRLMVEARTLGADFPVGKIGHIRGLLGQLGMTPADRSKVDLGKREEEPDDGFQTLN